MESQTENASQSAGGYPMSASGGIPLVQWAEDLRSGARQDVPDALTNPVPPATGNYDDERFGPPGGARAAGKGKLPILGIVVGLTFLLGIIVLLFATGFFGLFG